MYLCIKNNAENEIGKGQEQSRGVLTLGVGN